MADNDSSISTIDPNDIVVFLPPKEDSSSYTLLSTSSTSPILHSVKVPTSTATELIEQHLYPNPPPQHLNYDIHVIVSTHSGTGLAEKYFADVLNPLLDALELKYTKHTTAAQESIATTTRDILGGPDGSGNGKDILMIFLTGDTGVHEHVNALPNGGVGCKHTIAVLPLGTGNALATSWKLDLKTLIFGKRTHLPTATVKFSEGARFVADGKKVGDVGVKAIVVASWGLHASLVAGSDTPEYRKYGVKRFEMVAGELLQKMHVYRGIVTASLDANEGGEKVLGEEHMYVMLPLVDTLSAGFMISPKTKVGDKEVYMVYIPPVSTQTLMGAMTKAAQQGTHVQMSEVGYWQSHGWKIDMKEEGEDGTWRRCCVDGRIVEVEENGFVEVRVDEEEDKQWGVLSFH